MKEINFGKVPKPLIFKKKIKIKKDKSNKL